jgi:hypothetical protein
MLIFLLQTLAEILAGGTSLPGTKQVDFSHPNNRREEVTEPILNIYIYDIRESKQFQHSGRQLERNKTGSIQSATVSWPPTWFDISLLVTAWDKTALGEHQLLTEALTVLLRHRSLREEFLVPELRGYGNLSMSVSIEPAIEVGSLWSALTVPLRAALFLTVTVPFEAQSTTASLVWDRIVSVKDKNRPQSQPLVMVQQVKIAGIVKHSVTKAPLTGVKITVLGTEKVAVSNTEGLFFFENLRLGSYVVRLDCPDYAPQTVNFLVENHTHIIKEILLTPV